LKWCGVFSGFALIRDGWKKNPSRAIKLPVVRFAPTLPFSDEEMERILWACETVREIHPKIPAGMEKKLKALILLMRYSGIRISDAVMMMKRDRIKKGKLFVYTQKTGGARLGSAAERSAGCFRRVRRRGRILFPAAVVGTVKTEITEWQQRVEAGVQNCRIAGWAFPPFAGHICRRAFDERHSASNGFGSC